ncbi:MAG: AMP-binding protein [Clostridia bacterium]|nr:AMP-binding protein [Clostridia bacterium]
MIFETRELFRKYTDSDTLDTIVAYPAVVEMWRRCAADYAALVAVRDDDHDITYREMDSHMAGLRGKLRDLGLNPKDRVALLAPNGYECALAIMSVVTAGMTAIILPPQLPEQAVTGLCMMTGVKAIVYGESMA